MTGVAQVKPVPFAVRRIARWALLGASVAVHAAAPGGATPGFAEDMAGCLALAAPDTRLACYDALARRSAATSRLVAPSTATVAPQASAAARVDPADPQNFGLTLEQKHVVDAGPKAVEARITQVSADRLGHAVIVLDSGQTWKVADDDGRLSPGDRITIKRAALASFLLVAPSNHTYRVRRIE